MDWTKYLKDKYAPKPPTLGENILESAKKAAKELAEKYKWRTHDVAMTQHSVLLTYTHEGGLYTVLVPLKKIIHTLQITPHLELGVRKHLGRELKQKKEKFAKS